MKPNGIVGCDGIDAPPSPSTTEWIEIAKIEQASFFNRRDLEWKLAIGFWTGIGALTFAVCQQSLQVKNEQAVGWGYFAIWMLTTFTWKLAIQRSHSGDQAYLRQALSYARGDNPVNTIDKQKEAAWCDCFPYMTTRNWVWFFGQILMSAAVLYGSWWLIHLSNEKIIESKKQEAKPTRGQS